MLSLHVPGSGTKRSGLLHPISRVAARMKSVFYFTQICNKQGKIILLKRVSEAPYYGYLMRQSASKLIFLRHFIRSDPK